MALSRMVSEIQRQCLKIVKYTQPVFSAPVGVTPSEFRKDVRYREN